MDSHQLRRPQSQEGTPPCTHPLLARVSDTRGPTWFSWGCFTLNTGVRRRKCKEPHFYLSCFCSIARLWVVVVGSLNPCYEFSVYIYCSVIDDLGGDPEGPSGSWPTGSLSTQVIRCRGLLSFSHFLPMEKNLLYLHFFAFSEAA